jgi:hypothetical protein
MSSNNDKSVVSGHRTMKLGIAGLATALPASGGLGPQYQEASFGVISWDWNVCHDWYWNSEGGVDIATNIVYPWHGRPHDNGPVPAPLPPAPPLIPQPLPADCPPWSPILAPSRCGGL